ncbi:gas vesicle protein GvpO [Sphaerisporangium sp. TRM90804]|uniref:gas vesicle protein GvpO n=1 Tax=Sphaerisporangium sp. TRM90804 TaxID=3031113 RepID=UPI00244712DF|nr:gas vesicle protein GvpO [Sphaerisporangium sp. TRM90804]MDH2430161.1 gas vesicle protein [Sphaerisporangium sp. TRM90804]
MPASRRPRDPDAPRVYGAGRRARAGAPLDADVEAYDSGEEVLDEAGDLAEEEYEDDDLAGEEPERRPGRRDGGGAGRLTAATAGRAGLGYMTELTGKDVEGVTLVKPSGDGWAVEVEVVEDHRVPSSGDTLAVYAVDLDSRGDLVSYRRVRSYKRAKGDTGGAY